MKKFLNTFRRNEDGVVSLEFALIAPMMIFGTLFAINLGHQVNKHQKVGAALTAGSNYLQDYLMENAVEDLRPNYDSKTETVAEANLVNMIKRVVQSAYGEDLKFEEIAVDTYCGCPNPAGLNQGSGTNEPPDDGSFEMAIEQPVVDDSVGGFDFKDRTKDFYSRTNMSIWRKGELCAFDCPDPVGGRARVIMELHVHHRMYDLFGKETVVKKNLKTRVR